MTITVQYESRDMLEALRIAKTPPTFLQSLLVKREETHDTEQIEIDVEVEGQTIAAYVSRVGDAEDVNAEGYTSNIHLLPYTKQKTTATAKDLNDRIAGETIYEGNPRSRADKKVGKTLAKFRNRLMRLGEVQLSDAIVTGTQTISGKDFISYTIDYQRAAGNTGTALTGDARWGETSADIVANIRAAQSQLKLPGVDGGIGTIIILGEAAGNAFCDDSTIQGRLDLRRIDFGIIDPTVIAEQDATYLGYYKDNMVNADVYSYTAQYKDSAGSNQYIFPTNGFALINGNLRCEKHYSMISNFHSGNFIGREFPLFYITQDGSQAVIQLESGPVVATHEPNKIYYRQVGNA